MKKQEKRPANNLSNVKDVFHYLKLVVAVLALVFLVLASVFGYRFGAALFTEEGVLPEGKGQAYTLTVEQGESTFQIGLDLERHGIIRSALVFFVQSKLFKCRIDAGSYEVRSDQSSKAILKYLNQQYEKNRQ